jgi:branched-chain amino acid transport system permease protein
MNLCFFTLMYAVCASAWNILGGYSGYISLGHAAFFGIGAYAIAITFTRTGIGGGYRPFYVLPLVGFAGALISLPVGWIAFRTRAATFAIVTISFLFVVQLLAFNLHSVTSGAQGLAIPTPNFSVSSYEHPFYYAMLGLLAISVFTSWYVRGSKFGLALLSIRDDEDRARGLGVQTELAKLAAFSVSAGLIAMAGGLWAYYISFVYPQFAVDPLVTIGMVLMVYLGGRGTIWGPVLGAFILIPAQQELNDRLGASSLYLVGYSAVFLVVMLVLPRGILPSLADQIRRLRSRFHAAKREPEVVAP